uniref:OTU domain-containing protein n=1 Tax=Amphimedon queenslandica TaxID=400682 RepID=A0A1X7VD85_AMPQE
MLRRNIDVTVGLVNGAIGTVMGIYDTHLKLVVCALTKLTASEVNFGMTFLKSRKTSNPQNDDDVIFTYEEPPNSDIVRRRQWDYVYYSGNEEYQRCCEILNLKFVTAARILPCSPTTALSDGRVPNSTLDVPGHGNCLLYALSYLITGSISQCYKLRKAIVSNMPNFEQLFNSTTIYSHSLSPTFVGWARYATQSLYGIPCDTNTPALYLKHVGTNHFEAVKSFNIS